MSTYKRLPKVKTKTTQVEFVSFAAKCLIWVREHWKSALEVLALAVVVAGVAIGARGWWNLRANSAAEKLFAASKLEKGSEAQQKAIADVAADYSRTPSGKEAMMLLGDSYIKQGKFKEAIEEFRALAGRSRNNPMLYVAATHRMAEAQIASGDLSAAAETYLKAAADPSNLVSTLSRYNAALLLEKAGNVDGAVAAYKQVIEDSKEDTPEKKKSEERLIWLVSSGRVSGS